MSKPNNETDPDGHYTLTEAGIAFVLAFDPSALGKARKSSAKPVEVQKPNVQLFDDPTHNGQYWGE